MKGRKSPATPQAGLQERTLRSRTPATPRAGPQGRTPKTKTLTTLPAAAPAGRTPLQAQPRPGPGRTPKAKAPVTPQGPAQGRTPKTPKRTPKKKPATPTGLQLGEGGAALDPAQVRLCVSTLRSVWEKQKAERQARDDLFDDEATRIHVQITGIKLPKDSRQQQLRITYPHHYLMDPQDVCLVIKDIEKGIRPDHEPTLRQFETRLADQKVPESTLALIMPLRQLKVEYKTFETKTSLCHRFEKFLCDDRIIRLVPKLFGSPFYKRKRMPTPVNLQAPDLKGSIDRAIRTAILPLSHHGSCAMVTIGHLGMSDDAIEANLLVLGQTLSARYPGGWRNIRSLYLKSEKSMALPLHVSTISPNEVGFVDADIPERITREVVEDELSTQPGMRVKVTPGGAVKITKVVDPDWNGDKDEPFVDGSDMEEEDGERAGSDKENGPKSKKRKSDSKKKSEAPSKKAKKRGGQAKDEADSEDEDIDEAEMEYMRRVAEEEEQMEKNEQQEKDVKGKEESEAEEESDQEAAGDVEVNGVASSEDDDLDAEEDSEEDEEELGDDDQEVEEVIEDNDDDEEDDEDEESD